MLKERTTIVIPADSEPFKLLKEMPDFEAGEQTKEEEEPNLAIFLRSIKALEEMLKEWTTIVIPADSEPFKLLKEMPDFEASDPRLRGGKPAPAEAGEEAASK